MGPSICYSYREINVAYCRMRQCVALIGAGQSEISRHCFHKKTNRGSASKCRRVWCSTISVHAVGIDASQALWVSWQKGARHAPAVIYPIIFEGLFAGFTLPPDQVGDYIDKLMRIDGLRKVLLIAGVQRPARIIRARKRCKRNGGSLPPVFH